MEHAKKYLTFINQHLVENFRTMQKFKDVPREEGFAVLQEREDRVMHVFLPISNSFNGKRYRW